MTIMPALLSPYRFWCVQGVAREPKDVGSIIRALINNDKSGMTFKSLLFFHVDCRIRCIFRIGYLLSIDSRYMTHRLACRCTISHARPCIESPKACALFQHLSGIYTYTAYLYYEKRIQSKSQVHTTCVVFFLVYKKGLIRCCFYFSLSPFIFYTFYSTFTMVQLSLLTALALAGVSLAAPSARSNVGVTIKNQCDVDLDVYKLTNGHGNTDTSYKLSSGASKTVNVDSSWAGKSFSSSSS